LIRHPTSRTLPHQHSVVSKQRPANGDTGKRIRLCQRIKLTGGTPLDSENAAPTTQPMLMQLLPPPGYFSTIAFCLMRMSRST
jgi:hypothetical protein